jgi:type IV secretory pathway VirB10-like protein
MEDSDVCMHCGQPLPGRKVVSYGRTGPNRTGVIVTIALHLLLVAVWLFQPKMERHAPPKSGEAIVWLPPLKPNKPAAKPAEQAPKKTAKAAAPPPPPPPPNPALRAALGFWR